MISSKRSINYTYFRQYSQNKIYKVKMLNRANCTLGRGK